MFFYEDIPTAHLEEMFEAIENELIRHKRLNHLTEDRQVELENEYQVVLAELDSREK